MSIRCVCAKGHVLKVKERLAGTTGLCPVCRAPVKVPTLRDKKVSEDAVIAILGPHQTTETEAAALTDRSGEDERALQANLRSGIFGRGTVVKTCTRCLQEISADTHICPHCHTYIAQPSDFR